MLYLVGESMSTIGFKIVRFTEKRKILLVLFRGYPPISSIIIGTRVWATAQTDSAVFPDENLIKGIRYDSFFAKVIAIRVALTYSKMRNCDPLRSQTPDGADPKLYHSTIATHT